ncbi:MAG: dephospho-CoA kinase [Wenzhouxiangellaceae bacterium]
MQHRPYLIVLTGGIASGKTAVSDAFAGLGVPVVDTDQLARELVAPGSATLEAIARTFGPDVLDQEGALDRKRMRKLIFSDADARRRLEALLHPAIEALAERRLAEVNAPYAIVVVPLLVESGRFAERDRVLVVDVAPEVQIQRLMARDHTDRASAQAALAAQATREQRLAIADDVIDNSGSLEALGEQVRRLHERYLELAEQKAGRAATN